MRWSQTLVPTQKESPADAVIVSHKLLVRAGLVRQLAAGVFDFLPLGLRALRKAEQIVREEMDRIGCAELLLPTLQPVELWQQTGRDKSYGDNLFHLKDRHGRTQVLGPTHEEVITELIRGTVNSYKQLPLSLYQIQTKFRDEFRPRFGLLRVREFLMKDAYSFHADLTSLDKTYADMYGAYQRIYERCGVVAVPVEAESGPIGGSASHEFMAASEAGEDVLLFSDDGKYAANVEKAALGERPHTFGGTARRDYAKVHTPGLPGITEVAAHLKIEPRQMLKTLVFTAADTPAADARPESLSKPKYVAVVLRGDHDANEAKVRAAAKDAFGVADLALVDDAAVRADWPIGFVGPDKAVSDPQTVVLVDPDAAQDADWTVGANERDYHAHGFHWFRDAGDRLADPNKVRVADVRNAQDGDPSPTGGTLTSKRGIELGHVFKLGTKYSDALGATVLDAAGKQVPVIMGCYGIGVGRILIAAVEAGHDEKGIVWPAALAPFGCVVTPIKYEGEAARVADDLYAQLWAAGVDALLDDRDARPGAKFADADLVGFPVRLTVGDRGLKEGKVELKQRAASEPEMVPLGEAVARVQSLLRDQLT